MTHFTDANGKTWTIHLTIDAIDKINAIINKTAPKRVDLLELADETGAFAPEVFLSLFVSPRRMAAVLAEAVALETGSDEENRLLAEGLHGDAIDAAFKAFFEDLSLFFPESQRPVIRAVFGSYQKATISMGETVAAMLEKDVNSKLRDIGFPEPGAK